MARATRSRLQTPVSVNTEADAKTSARHTAAGRTTKGRSVKVKSSAKNISDENAAPPAKSSKLSNVKNSQSKASVLGSKLHSAKKDSSLVRGNTLLALKSPVLRDRTNTTSELAKVELPSKKANEVQSEEKKKPVKANAVKKNDRKLVDGVRVSIEKYMVKGAKVQKEDKKSNSEETEEEPSCEKQLSNNKLDKANSNKQSSLSKMKKGAKQIEPSIDENNDENQNEEPVSNRKSVSQDSNVVKNRVPRRINISIEDVEQLLNEDDEIMEVESDKKEDLKTRLNVQKDAVLRFVDTENTKKDQKVANKFFKNKGVVEDVEPVADNKKIERRQVNNRKKVGARKKVENNDSTFSLILEEQRESTIPPEKKLRPRTNKNYCEVSKLSQSSNSNEDKGDKDKADVEHVNVEKNLKGVPIYRTIKLSQDNVKDKEEVYKFSDDSQENTDQKGKKRKKTVKRPAAKRARKATASKPATMQKAQKKPTKKVPRTVQFKEQHKEPIHIDETVNNIETNIVPEASVVPIIIPEHLENAGDSTIAEASTIKILFDKKLEGSKRISLTATPPVPKTITSELKLFGPKNAITSKPTMKYSNMVNHSLIRKSMSPITKLVDNFDAGSPWRAADAFSRVNRVVQSTPQTIRLPSMRERKLPTHLLHLHKKSISSEDTIHVSSIDEEKLSSKEDNIDVLSSTKKNEVSPRKFGTVISNLSPVQSATNQSVNNSKSPVQNNLQSPVQAASPSVTSLDIPMDQDEIPTLLAINHKENTLSSPKKSPKKKFGTPSPFRFEKIRSKRIISIESQSKIPKSNLQKEIEELEPEAGPSGLDKLKPVVLKQSNLNNFLNLDEMPESTRISTVHGIFDDVHSTPITGKKPKKLIEEPNVDNAFGFDDYDISEVSSVIDKPSSSIIATENDVKQSAKGKLFPRARVKSSVPSRISENTVKRTLLRNVMQKRKPEKDVPELFIESGESDSNDENNKVNRDVENNNKPEATKKAILDAVSFSDTFDVHSENGEEIELTEPKEIPLFVDLEPVRFTKPPRRSYNKRKRAVYFESRKDDFDSDDDDEDEKPKPKKKKVSKLDKDEQKRMKEWLDNINKTFDEIEHYDLIVE